MVGGVSAERLHISVPKESPRCSLVVCMQCHISRYRNPAKFTASPRGVVPVHFLHRAPPHPARHTSRFGNLLCHSRNFFKYYKVNLDQECPFWEEDGQCMMKDCSVCECSPEEIPKPWLEEVRCKNAASQELA